MSSCQINGWEYKGREYSQKGLLSFPHLASWTRQGGPAIICARHFYRCRRFLEVSNEHHFRSGRGETACNEGFDNDLFVVALNAAQQGIQAFLGEIEANFGAHFPEIAQP